MSSIMRARNGLMASREVVEVIEGSCLELELETPQSSRQDVSPVTTCSSVGYSAPKHGTARAQRTPA